MKLTICCGGLIRIGPERELVDDYLKRANGLAAQCGFHSVTEVQVDLKRLKTRADETKKLVDYIGPNTIAVFMDERGKSLTSRQIANFLSKSALSGQSELMFLIGGADGFDKDVLPKPNTSWSFGTQTWPHKLVRVMLAEQIYRSFSILAGSPYHRD